jgi:hypothetical protein
VCAIQVVSLIAAAALAGQVIFSAKRVVPPPIFLRTAVSKSVTVKAPAESTR